MGKTYVVFEGFHPGIYESWDECKLETDGYSGARFKAFSSRTEAIIAYRNKEKDAPMVLQNIARHLKESQESEPVSVCAGQSESLSSGSDSRQYCRRCRV